MKEKFDRRQLMALTFCATLAPGIRLMPGYCARIGGKAGFISPLIALPLLCVYAFLLSAYLKRRRQGEGLGELIYRSCGKVFGGAVLTLTALFLIFCSGFVLRSGADRFISTVYPDASPGVFILVMFVIGLIAAMGQRGQLIRSAKLFTPILCAVIILVLVFLLQDIDFELIAPLSDLKPLDVVKAAMPMFEIYSGMLAYSAFFEGEYAKDSKRGRREAVRCVPVCLLFSVLCLCAIGTYGAPMVGKFKHPFFSMIRNLTLFGTIEHVEAVIVALWVLPDFIVFVMMLFVAAHSLRLVFGYKPTDSEGGLKDLKNGRYLIPVCAALSLLSAFLTGLGSGDLRVLSEQIVPLANMVVCLVLVPLCFLVSSLKDR